VLREIYFTRKDEDPESHLDRLEALKAKAEHSDALVDGTLDKLIREQKISSQMATSLANDSEITAEISKLLIDTAELLYINSDTLIEATEEEKRERDKKKEKEEAKKEKKEKEKTKKEKKEKEKAAKK
jgi:phosphate:Na+ symporter